MAMRWLTIAQRLACRAAAVLGCWVVLCPQAGSAQPPPEVINRASLEFGDPVSGQLVRLESEPVRVVLGSATNPPAELHFYADATYVRVIQITTVGQALFLEAWAPGCSPDPSRVHTNRIVIRSQKTGDQESFLAVETEPGSGRYRLLAPAPTRSGTAFPTVPANGIVETVKSDWLTAELQACGDPPARATVLVDPGGVVFDSHNNQPVPGARVLLVDASSGQPAAVWMPDGSTPAPNPVVTGPDGVYVFPRLAPGTYVLEVRPPPDYTAPSQVPVAKLPPGRAVGWPASYGGAFRVSATETVLQVDIPVDPLPDSGLGLFLQKSVSRASAEIGDVLTYALRVKNVSGVKLASVQVWDRLPLGFAYLKGSAQLDGRPVADPAGGSGPNLQFELGALESEATVSLTYRVRVGPGALRGDGENLAQALSPGPPRRVSNQARAKVQVSGGIFTERGHLVGKVFVDLNTNQVQDPGEPGVPGVRLYLEDGTYVVTDSEGKYDIYGLRPVTHVLKLDPTTLPRGARLLAVDHRDALSPGTRFVDVRAFELQKANFALAPEPASVLEEVAARRQAAGSSPRELDSGLNTPLTRDGAPVPLGDPRARPASGIVGTTPTLSAPKATAARAANTNATSKTPAQAVAGPATNALAPVQPSGPPLVLGQALTNLDNALGFVGLRDGDTLPVAQATFWVKGQFGARFSLHVNGAPVPEHRIGRRATDPDRQLEAWEFVGVSLRPGTNRLVLTQHDPFGNARGSVTCTVVAPDKLGRIRIRLPKEEPVADGKTPVRITVLLEDARGVPVTARTPLTLETSLGQWQVTDLNPQEPGVQVFVEGGQAEFELKPPLEPGEARLVVSSGALRGEERLAFVPELRPLLAVGVVEGRLHLRHLGAGAIVPARRTDGFEEELRHWSVRSDDGQVSASGRTAFFLKGKIKGQYLLTAAYDSDKDTRERLFRDIQPDEYYPVYGDDALKGFDAQSTARFYVRVDKRRCYLLYGDYTTTQPSEARGLGQYARSLTGVKYHYETDRLTANLWATHDTTRQVIQEVPANGTSGPYFVGVRNGLVNSEKVELVTRDRHQPELVLKVEPQTRFVDYEFEPFTGRVLFRRPIPSLDADLNPIFVRITYEADTGAEAYWTVGGDAQARLTRRWEVGGSAVRDQDPLAPYRLYSAHTTYKLGAQTLLLGEVARSDLAGVTGNAGRAELRHQGQRLDLRVRYGQTEATFSNAAAVLGPGRIEAGLNFAYKLAPNTRLVGQAIDSESTAQTGPITGRRTGGTLGLEHTFTNQMKLEVGGRYSTETAAPASPSTAAPAGLTPNEVRSGRVKFTTPVPRLKNASAYAEYENDLVETRNRMVAVGGDFQLRPKTRLYARHEFLDALASPYELNRFQQRNTTLVGLDTQYMKNGQSFNEYRMRDAVSGREAEAAIGLRNQWPIADGLRANTSFERVTPIVGQTRQNEATALTGGIEYTRNPNWKGTARLELRDAAANNSLLNTLGYARKLSRDWTFLGRTILYLVDNETPSGHDVVQGRFQAGLAWRQTQTDRWNVLAKYEFKIEDGDVFTMAEMDRKVNLVSVHAHYQPAAEWQLSTHYALKFALQDDTRTDRRYDAHLVAFRVTHDLGRYFDLGLNSAVLFDRGGRGVSYALGPELGIIIKRNLRVGIGYNFLGFYDRDLSAENYTQQGVYLALRLKFDEESLGLAKKQP